MFSRKSILLAPPLGISVNDFCRNICMTSDGLQNPLNKCLVNLKCSSTLSYVSFQSYEQKQDFNPIS